MVELVDAYEISASVVDTAILEWRLRGFWDAISGIRSNHLSNYANMFSNQNEEK